MEKARDEAERMRTEYEAFKRESEENPPIDFAKLFGNVREDIESSDRKDDNDDI
jgi:hypothetical protein